MLMAKKLLSLAAMVAMIFSASATEVTLWEGETVFEGWSQNIIIAGSDLSALGAGDQITVHLKDCGTVVDKDYSTIVLKTNTEGWPELPGQTYENPAKGSTSWTATLSADAVTTAKATGIIVQGENFTATKVTLTTAADIDYDLVWEGTQPLSGWGSEKLEIACSTLVKDKIAAGDKLRIAYESTGSSFKVQYVTQDWGWTDWAAFLSLPDVNQEYGTLYVANNGAIEIPIDDAAMKVIEENRSLVIYGDKGVTITKVEIVRTDNGTTGIENIEISDSDDAPVEYYTIQGVRVENPSNGLYIRRQGNKASKVIL